MLRGNSETKVDEKGRLKIPAAFKKVLDEAFPESKFFVTSLEGKSALIYPLQEWIKVEEKFKSSFDPLMTDLKHKVNYWGGEAEMDTQGRILMPQVLREHLKMQGEVSVMGMTNYLEVYTAEKARQRAEREFTPDEWSKLEQRGI
jgi:MraZ protein